MNKEQDTGHMPRASVDLTALDPIYTVSQDTQLELRDLFEAFDAVGNLTEAADGEEDPAVGLSGIASLQRSLTAFGKRLLADMTPQFPTLRGPAAQ